MASPARRCSSFRPKFPWAPTARTHSKEARMKKIIILAALLVTGQARADKLQVVTSIETLASLAREVGGDRVDVRSLSHGYEDPHFVQAKPSLVVTLNRTDVLIYVGLELEVGWL